MRYYLSMVDEFVILTSPSFLDKNFFTININETIKKQKPVVGRYFISQIFNEYLRDKKRVSFELLKKHISLGLIRYVKEYNFWHSYFSVNSKIQHKIKFNFLNLIPACGEGKRFSDIKKSIDDLVIEKIKLSLNQILLLKVI